MKSSKISISLLHIIHFLIGYCGFIIYFVADHILGLNSNSYFNNPTIINIVCITWALGYWFFYALPKISFYKFFGFSPKNITEEKLAICKTKLKKQFEDNMLSFFVSDLNLDQNGISVDSPRIADQKQKKILKDDRHLQNMINLVVHDYHLMTKDDVREIMQNMMIKHVDYFVSESE